MTQQYIVIAVLLVIMFIMIAWWLSRLMIPQWRSVIESGPPPVGTWCWVSDGFTVTLAEYTPEGMACYWTNQDTWTDYHGWVKYYIPLVTPEKPISSIHVKPNNLRSSKTDV